METSNSVDNGAQDLILKTVGVKDGLSLISGISENNEILSSGISDKLILVNDSVAEIEKTGIHNKDNVTELSELIGKFITE